MTNYEWNIKLAQALAKQIKSNVHEVVPFEKFAGTAAEFEKAAKDAGLKVIARNAYSVVVGR